MTVLYMLCGVPGSGKSTWARKKIEELGSEKVDLVSRDKIRFSKLAPGEDYFSHEDEVMDDFIAQIQNDIDDRIPYIIADATHLTIKSRCQVLERLRLTGVFVNYVCFEVPLDAAIQRNNLRQGRELVPETVIVNMFNCYVRPKGFVTVVNKEGRETII